MSAFQNKTLIFVDRHVPCAFRLRNGHIQQQLDGFFGNGVSQFDGQFEFDVQSSSEMATFTLEELSQYNGKNGAKAYVAVDGVVYDVTDVPAWKNGEHKNGLTAGKDLSKEILSSPHGKKVLENLPVVGKLVK